MTTSPPNRTPLNRTSPNRTSLARTSLALPRTLILGAALLLGVQISYAQPAAPQTKTQQAQTQQAQVQQPAPLTLPAGVQYIASAEGISEYRLANGLKVLLAPSQANAMFTQHVTYLVGSVQEGVGEGGMAHLLEHMMFKGTTDHPNIPSDLRARGADSNAMTTPEYTDYYATLNASRENLDFITALEADRMVNSLIRPEDLSSEMTVVMNEFDNGENNPDGLLYKAVHKAAYSFHPIGRDVVGNRSEVAQVPASSLKTFYQKYYQPDNAVITLTGNIDPQYALERINATFGKIPRPDRQLPSAYTVEPAQQGEKIISVRRAGTVPILLNAYHIPAITHPDAAALQMLSALLSQEPEGRLYQALVKTGLASNSGTMAEQYTVPGLSYFQAILPAHATDAQLDKARAALQEVAEGVAKKPFTEAEVSQIRKRIQTSFERLARDPAQSAENIISLLPTGDWRSYFVGRDALLAVTAADVNRVAAQYLRPTNRTAGTFYPTAAAAVQASLVKVPAAPSMAALLKDFKPRTISAAGEQINTDLAALEARTVRSEVAGVKAAYFKKATQDGRVNVRLSLDLGNLQTADSALIRDAANYIPSMLLRGARGLTPEQLKDQLAALNASLSISGDASELTLDVSAPPEHLAQALTLGRRLLREPVWNQNDFAELKKSSITDLQSLKDNPNWQAQIALRRAFDPVGGVRGSHRYTRNYDERLQDAQAVNLADVKAAYQQLWGYAGSGQLAVVGPFDRRVVDQSISELLSGWKAKVPYVRVPSELVVPQGRTISVPIADKSGAVIIASQAVPLRQDSPEYAALDVAAEILGGDGLSSRLATQLRQKDGQSYSSGLSLDGGTQDPVGAISLYATTAPSALSQTEAGIRAVLKEALDKGFTTKEVEQIKAAALQARTANRSTDGYLLSTLVSQLYLGKTFADTAKQDAALQAVTPETAYAALKKYLDPSKLVIIKAGTF